MHNPKDGYYASKLKLKPQILLLALSPEISQTKLILIERYKLEPHLQ